MKYSRRSNCFDSTDLFYIKKWCIQIVLHNFKLTFINTQFIGDEWSKTFFDLLYLVARVSGMEVA